MTSKITKVFYKAALDISRAAHVAKVGLKHVFCRHMVCESQSVVLKRYKGHEIKGPYIRFNDPLDGRLIANREVKVDLPDGEKAAIVCRHMAVMEAYRRIAEKPHEDTLASRAQTFSVEKNTEIASRYTNLEKNFNYYEHFAPSYDRIQFDKFGTFLTDHFALMPVGKQEVFLATLTTHAIMITLKHKSDQNYSVTIWDPNLPNAHIKCRFNSDMQGNKMKLSHFLDSEYIKWVTSLSPLHEHLYNQLCADWRFSDKEGYMLVYPIIREFQATACRDLNQDVKVTMYDQAGITRRQVKRSDWHERVGPEWIHDVLDNHAGRE